MRSRRRTCLRTILAFVAIGILFPAALPAECSERDHDRQEMSHMPSDDGQSHDHHTDLQCHRTATCCFSTIAPVVGVTDMVTLGVAVRNIADPESADDIPARLPSIPPPRA